MLFLNQNPPCYVLCSHFTSTSVAIGPNFNDNSVYLNPDVCGDPKLSIAGITRLDWFDHENMAARYPCLVESFRALLGMKNERSPNITVSRFRFQNRHNARPIYKIGNSTGDLLLSIRHRGVVQHSKQSLRQL